eukprot:7388706-Prymnesium_polylepis.1
MVERCDVSERLRSAQDWATLPCAVARRGRGGGPADRSRVSCAVRGGRAGGSLAARCRDARAPSTSPCAAPGTHTSHARCVCTVSARVCSARQ